MFRVNRARGKRSDYNFRSDPIDCLLTITLRIERNNIVPGNFDQRDLTRSNATTTAVAGRLISL